MSTGLRLRNANAPALAGASVEQWRARQWPRTGCKGRRRRPAGHLTLTSLTSNTTAWFGPIGDCGVLP